MGLADPTNDVQKTSGQAVEVWAGLCEVLKETESH